jgi:short-subunit dehydrogenase
VSRPPIRRAVITGASAGLGASFARHLAARGVDVTLVARRSDRLQAMAGELGGDVEVLVADLVDRDDLERVAARLDDPQRPVDLLVNNAGLGAYGDVADLDADLQVRLVDLNVAALVRLTRAVLPQLQARRGGAVIQVGSTAGFQPGPHGAVYGATKAFVRSFTEALHEELRGSGVQVLLLAPGFTETEFQAVAGVAPDAVPKAARMDADEVVATALRDLVRGRAVSVPGAWNRVTAYGSQVTPSSVTRRASAVVHRRFVGRS